MLNGTFNPLTSSFIARHGGMIKKHAPQDAIYLQGDPAEELFYILRGKVFVTIGTEDGKEALIAVLKPKQFFGEDCVSAEKLRSSAVLAATDCVVAAFRTNDVLHTFRNEPDFTRCFAAFLMERNKQLRASLVDQMLLSSEKRLARLLLKFVPSEKDTELDLDGVPLNQDMIARMVGTTRPRISEFMNKFRSLGHIEYSNGHLKVYESLSAVLIDDGSSRTQRMQV
jgi:CRP-like cAMP-binding protein